jgi:hypothetical protein
MTARFHPEFPAEVRRFAKDYAGISIGLGERFRGEIDAGIVAIKSSPGSAGHFLDLGSSIVPEVRRRNLHAFPFFHSLRRRRRRLDFRFGTSQPI